MSKYICPVTVIVLIALTVTASKAQKGSVRAEAVGCFHMNLTAKPGNDFREYAGGTWIKNNPVPAKETTWVVLAFFGL